MHRLRAQVLKALEYQALVAENHELRQRLRSEAEPTLLLGDSAAMQRVRRTIEEVARTDVTVLIEGESGTGKELIAQAIHQVSPRSRAPFIAVHCAALSENLLESEIFGHERGAFTGATERRIGRFEAADGGTLFLDEIGEITASTQVKLLRFLETRTVERVGGNKPLELDVRLVAATNRSLEQMVREGKFREDLFFRLNVVRIGLPPLRERPDDIPLLLTHYLKHFAQENGFPASSVEPDAMRCLQTYPWPGNIRELRNFAENIVVLQQGRKLTEYDLEPKFRGLVPALPSGAAGSGGAGAGTFGGAGAGSTGMSGGFGGAQGSFGAGTGGAVPVTPGWTMAPGRALSVEENEKRLLREALIKARGNRTRAAELMGISRRTLHRKLAQWPDLDVKEG
jgi:DNA-binding NtrC family response regulator